MKKGLAFALFLTLACSTVLITIGSSGVSAYPSTPEFSVNLVAYPYDVPPQTTTTIDQYTGEEIVHTTPGYHVENKSIEIKIKNPTNTLYKDSDGTRLSIYYNVRVKGYFGTEWTELYPESYRREYRGYDEIVSQSDTEYTIINCSAKYASGDQVDFQVQARKGYHNLRQPFWMSGYTYEFVGTYSPWSETQALMIGEPEYQTTSTETENTQSKQITTESPPTGATTTQTDNVQQVTQNKDFFNLELKDVAIWFLAITVTALTIILVVSRKKSNTKKPLEDK